MLVYIYILLFYSIAVLFPMWSLQTDLLGSLAGIWIRECHVNLSDEAHIQTNETTGSCGVSAEAQSVDHFDRRFRLCYVVLSLSSCSLSKIKITWSHGSSVHIRVLRYTTKAHVEFG